MRLVKKGIYDYIMNDIYHISRDILDEAPDYIITVSVSAPVWNWFEWISPYFLEDER